MTTRPFVEVLSIKLGGGVVQSLSMLFIWDLCNISFVITQDSLRLKCMTKKIKKTVKSGDVDESFKNTRDSFAQRLWEESWTYIKTVVDTAREPFLILDKNLRVMVANESFYRTFHVDQVDTENKLVYKLGNGQWDIPSLRRLLEDILPRNTFFKGFEVNHDFPVVGHKVMILNARQIHREDTSSKHFPPIILLAMEDVTEMMTVAEKFVLHTNEFESTIIKRTNTLEDSINELKKEVTILSAIKGK